MQIAFIGQKKTEHGAKKKELESVVALRKTPANVSKERKKQAAYDERIRNAIEGKFGQGKRRFSLARIMAKLENTSRTAIAITFLVINLSTWWRRVFCVFLCYSGKTIAVFGLSIIGAYISVKSIQENLSLTRFEYIDHFSYWESDQLFLSGFCVPSRAVCECKAYLDRVSAAVYC
jgi:hypothetical protein